MTDLISFFTSIMQVITNDQMFMSLLFIFYVFKNLYIPILLHSFPPFFPLPQTHFHKPYPQSKTFFNMWTVPSSAAFCSNALLRTTPSSSMQFSSFFDVLPSTPVTTGINLMLLMFHILLVFSLVSGISQFFLSLFL